MRAESEDRQIIQTNQTKTMSTEILEAEIVAPINAQLVKYAEQTGLEKPASETLIEAFRPVFIKARAAIQSAAGIAESVKDATCVTEIRKSRQCRLAIRAVRLMGEAVHKKQKESALRFGRAVDGFRNILLADLEPVETRLMEAEDTAERAEAARKATLKAAREQELQPWLDSPILGDLSELSEASYADALADAKLLRQAKLDALAKIEADRIAKEEAERKERERIAAENTRLKAEALALEAAAKAEREAAEKKLTEERRAANQAAKAAAAKAKAEREAVEAEARKENQRLEAIANAERKKAEAIEDEVRAVRAAEARKAAAAAAAAKKAAAAPDRAKLLALADTIAEMELPNLSDEALMDAVKLRVRDLASWCSGQAAKLE